MHPILFTLIVGLLVTLQPVHAASPAAGTDSIAAIVSDFDDCPARIARTLLVDGSSQSGLRFFLKKR